MAWNYNAYIFEQNMKKIFEKYGITYKECAKEIDINKNTMTAYFKDENHNAPWYTVFNLIDFLNATPKRLEAIEDAKKKAVDKKIAEEEKEIKKAEKKGLPYNKKKIKSYTKKIIPALNANELFKGVFFKFDIPPLVLNIEDERLKALNDIKDKDEIYAFLKMINSPFFSTLLKRIAKYGKSSWADKNIGLNYDAEFIRNEEMQDKIEEWKCLIEDYKLKIKYYEDLIEKCQSDKEFNKLEIRKTRAKRGVDGKEKKYMLNMIVESDHYEWDTTKYFLNQGHNRRVFQSLAAVLLDIFGEDKYYSELYGTHPVYALEDLAINAFTDGEIKEIKRQIKIKKVKFDVPITKSRLKEVENTEETDDEV